MPMAMFVKSEPIVFEEKPIPRAVDAFVHVTATAIRGTDVRTLQGAYLVEAG